SVKLPKLLKVTNPPLPKAEPEDPPVAETINSPDPDPIFKSPNVEILINPPLCEPAPSAAKVTLSPVTCTPVTVVMLIEPPLPSPTPLALMAPPLIRLRTDPARDIEPPLPLAPSGATFTDAGSSVMLPPLFKFT